MCNKITGECLYSSVEEVLLNHGSDWSNLNFVNNINLTNSDLRNIVLPKDPLFLQKIQRKSLAFVKLPSQDLSHYNWKGVIIEFAEF